MLPCWLGAFCGDDHPCLVVFPLLTGVESWAAAGLVVWALSFLFFTCAFPAPSTCLQPFLLPPLPQVLLSLVCALCAPPRVGLNTSLAPGGVSQCGVPGQSQA